MRFSLATLLMLAIACGPAVSARPEQDAADHYSLGLAFYDKGQLDEAIAEFRKAIELDPNDPDAERNLEEVLRLQKSRTPEQ